MADIESKIGISIDASDALAAIKALQSQISAFHQSIRNSGNAVNQAVSDDLAKNLLNSINSTKKFAASLTTVNDEAEAFTTALEKNKLSLGQYFKYGVASSKNFSKVFTSEFNTIEKVARERVKTIQTQYINMGRTASGSLEAIKVRPLRLDMEALGTQVAMTAQKQQIFNQLIKQGSTNLLNFGKNTQWAGRQLMVGFTIPLSILGSTASKSFMEIEKQVIRFRRVYGDTFTSSTETDKMIGQLKDLSSEFTKYGVAVSDTMALAADAAAMGKTNADLLAQVTEATKLAVLGEVDQQQALETTISISNAFGIAAEDLAGKINFLNAVENQTVTSIEDLTIAIPKAGPVIQQLGGSVEDLAFFLTAMKEGGINASEGANALKSGLASIINPTRQASDMLAGFGINIKGIVEANQGDLKGTLIGFAQALDTIDPLNRARAIEQMFGKFQFARISTLFENINKEGSQAQRVLEITRQTSAELEILSKRELKSIEDSPMFKFQKAVEDIQKSLAPLGEQFLKLMTPVIEFGTQMLEKFNSLDDGAKTLITRIVGFFGLIAPAAIMGFGLIANGIANFIKGLNFVRIMFGKLSGAGTGLNQMTSYMTQEHLEATAAAAGLGSAHSALTGIFSSEKVAIDGLVTSYQNATVAMQRYNVAAQKRARPGKGGSAAPGYANGILSVPGPKGAGDIVPAMLSPGEAVVPAEQAQKYGALIQGIVADNIPGFERSNVDISGRKISFGGASFAASGDAGELAKTVDKLIEAARLLGLSAEDATNAVADLAREVEKDSKNKSVSAAALQEKEKQRFGGGLSLVGNRTVGVREALEKERLVMGNEGVTLSHAGTPTPLSEEQRLKIAAQMSPSVNRARVADMSKPLNIYSEEVFQTPAILNAKGGILSRGQAADIIRQDPASLARDAAESAGLNPNSPAFKQFGENVADELAKDATAAFSDMDLTPAVRKAVEKMEAGVEKEALKSRQKTYAVVGGGKNDKRFTLPSNIDMAGEELGLAPGTRIKGGSSYITRRDKKSSEERLREHKKADVAVMAVARKRVRDAEEQGKKEGSANANAYQKARKAILAKKDSFVETRDRNSPHRLAAKDGADDGKAYSKARNTEMSKEDKKLQRQAAAQRRQQVAGRAFGALGTASLVAGMATQLGGPVGQAANAIMPALTGLTAIAPLLLALPAPLALLAAGIGVAAFAVYKWNKNISDGAKKGRELANAMSLTSDKLDAISEVTGTVTATQLAQANRAQQLTGEDAKKRQFGQQFVESDAGQQLLNNAKSIISSGAVQDVAANLGNQISYAVLQGALTPEQARSIAIGLGEQLGNYSLGMEIAGNITSLIGPNGEDLTKDPLRIALAIQKESVTEQTAAYDNAITEIENNAAVDGGTIGNLLGAAAMTALGIALTPFTGPLGVGLIAGGIATGIAVGVNEGFADATENIQASSVAVQLGAEQISQNQGLLDSLERQYNSQIDALKIKKEAAKTDEDRKTIEDEITKAIFDRDKALETQKNKNKQVFDNLLKQAKTLGPAFGDAIGLSIDEKFKDASGALKAAVDLAKTSLKDMADSDFKTTLQLGLASGEFDPITITNLVNAAAENEDLSVKFKAVLDMAGSADANQLLQLLGSSNVKSSEYQVFMDFIVKDKADFDANLEALSQISSMQAEYGVTVIPTIENLDEIGNFIDDTNSLKDNDKITVDVVSDFLTANSQNLSSTTVKGLQDMINNWDELTNGTNTAKYQILVDFMVGKANDAAMIAWYQATHPEEFQKMLGNGPMVADRVSGKLDMAKITAAFIGQGTQTITGEEGGKGGGGGGGTAVDPYADILTRLKQVRDASIDTAGGLEELRRVLGKSRKDLTQFSGTETQLIFAGYSRSFIDAINGMDEKTRSKFVSIKNGIVSVKTAGKDLNAALSEQSIGDYIVGLQQGTADANKQVTAMTKLVAAGMNVSDAQKVASDTALAYAISTATTSSEVLTLVDAFNKLEAAQKKVELSTPAGRQAEFNAVASEATAFFSAQQEMYDQQYQAGIKAYEDANQIVDAQRSLADKQYNLDDLQYALDGVAEQEREINEEYDKRQSAIEDIYNANSKVIDQDRDKLDVASALASGDLAAAAKAIQTAQKNTIEAKKQEQLDNLQRSRELSLAQVRDTQGRSRIEIEKEIRDLEKEIAVIQETKLEPYQKEIDRLDRIRQDAMRDVSDTGFLGLTQARWTEIANEIERARFNVDGYSQTLQDRLSAIQGVTVGTDGSISVDAGQLQTPDVNPPASGTVKTPEMSETEKQIAELNRRITTTRWRLYHTELDAATKKAYMDLNVKRINEVKRLGGTPNMTGQTEPGSTTKIVDLAKGFSKGGIVPRYFANGGFAIGTDTVPAMLTPGEFVVRRDSVANFGVDRLKAINSGTYNGDSVYNYSVNVNVRSDSNPDQIAKSVMAEIRRVDSQRIKGNRF